MNTCAHCGVSFAPRRGNHLYCCDACRLETWDDRHISPTRLNILRHLAIANSWIIAPLSRHGGYTKARNYVLDAMYDRVMPLVYRVCNKGRCVYKITDYGREVLAKMDRMTDGIA